MQHRRFAFGLLATVALATACSDSPSDITSPLASPLASAAAEALDAATSLNLYGAGGFARAHPGSPCLVGKSREFDFWLGDWDVLGANGARVGINTITRELDGCLISENWTAVGGGRGRSINAYDSETDSWHQTWVSPFSLQHVRMQGGIVDGQMLLKGVRVSPLLGFTIYDEYHWTVLGPDLVRQDGSLTAPEVGLVSTFTGFYHRVAELPVIPELITTQCQPGGISQATRRLDFNVGTWRVMTDHGRELGTSVVRTDLRDCLFEERFTTSKGYEAVAFTYNDRATGKWYRTYIDSEGERIELSGVFQGDALVLVGTEEGQGHTSHLRLTIAPRAGGGVDQTMELSRDGGSTWKRGLALQFVE